MEKKVWNCAIFSYQYLENQFFEIQFSKLKNRIWWKSRLSLSTLNSIAKSNHSLYDFDFVWIYV